MGIEKQRLREGFLNAYPKQKTTMVIDISAMKELVGMAHYTASNLLHIRLLNQEKTHSRALKEALKNDIRELREHIEMIEKIKIECGLQRS